MSRPETLSQVRKRIESANPGDVFIPADFSDIAEARKITMCLSRLLKDGTLEKVKRGVYMKPRYSTLLKCQVPPKADTVASAIARNYGWTIVPCGDTALNYLGLSTQIPAVWAYVSDGPYKSYDAGHMHFQFKHTDKKNELIGISRTTAVVIQALRALGKDGIDTDVIRRLSDVLSREEKQQMLRESQYTASWIYETIKQIAGGQST